MSERSGLEVPIPDRIGRRRFSGTDQESGELIPQILPRLNFTMNHSIMNGAKATFQQFVSLCYANYQAKLSSNTTEQDVGVLRKWLRFLRSKRFSHGVTAQTNFKLN